MKLVLAVVQNADASTLVRLLGSQAFDVTKLASTGGFLREGNTTLMIGVSDERLEELKRLIRQSGRTRTRQVAATSSPRDQAEDVSDDPMQVSVGGAVIFVLDVEEFTKV
jgi:uncharacterized protein YaaQ